MCTNRMADAKAPSGTSVGTWSTTSSFSATRQKLPTVVFNRLLVPSQYMPLGSEDRKVSKTPRRRLRNLRILQSEYGPLPPPFSATRQKLPTVVFNRLALGQCGPKGLQDAMPPVVRLENVLCLRDDLALRS